MEDVMAIKTLLLGMLFSMGIFAVKSGFGLNYYLGTCTTTARKIQGGAFFIAAYGLVFLISAYMVTATDLMAWFPLFQIILSHAMTLHFGLAMLMCLWGVLLIRRKKENPTGTRGWMLLALPCPVCMVVIFLSTAFVTAYAPGHAKQAVFLTFMGFTALNLSTQGVLYAVQNSTRSAPDHLLGNAMVFMAVYFLLSMIVIPQFTGIEEIYSLSRHAGATGKDLIMEKRWTLGLLVLLFFTGTVTAGLSSRTWARRAGACPQQTGKNL